MNAYLAIGLTTLAIASITVVYGIYKSAKDFERMMDDMENYDKFRGLPEPKASTLKPVKGGKK